MGQMERAMLLRWLGWMILAPAGLFLTIGVAAALFNPSAPPASPLRWAVLLTLVGAGAALWGVGRHRGRGAGDRRRLPPDRQERRLDGRLARDPARGAVPGGRRGHPRRRLALVPGQRGDPGAGLRRAAAPRQHLRRGAGAPTPGPDRAPGGRGIAARRVVFFLLEEGHRDAQSAAPSGRAGFVFAGE